MNGILFTAKFDKLLHIILSAALGKAKIKSACY